MELDELKENWIKLDNQLKKNEALNECIIKEMLQSKSNKALKQLSNIEWRGIIAICVGVPALIYVLNNHLSSVDPRLFLLFKYSFIVCIILTSIRSVFQIWKIYTLMKIDFSKAISENFSLIQRYDIQIKREKIYSGILLFAIAVVLLIPLFILNFSGTEIWKPVFIVTSLIFGAIRFFWQYKKDYDANIQSIKKSLEELRELDEE